MCWLQLIDICFAFWLVSWLTHSCNFDVSFLTHSHLNLCVRLQLCMSRLIWSLHCICDMLLLAWLFKWMSWCKLAHWFEFLFCSAFFLCVHFIIAESSLIYLALELMLRISWLSLQFEVLSVCWICVMCEIDEWVHISLSWRKSHIIWLNSDTFYKLLSACSSSVLWISCMWVDWCHQ